MLSSGVCAEWGGTYISCTTRSGLQQGLEKQVGQAGVVCYGGSRFSLGGVWGICGGSLRLHGLLDCLRRCCRQVLGSLATGFGNLARKQERTSEIYQAVLTPIILRCLPRRAFSRDFAANSPQFTSYHRIKRAVFHVFL